jgi:methionine synthase reductase
MKFLFFRQLFLRALIEYTSHQDEKRFLEILCSKEGATTYANSIVNQKFTFLDVLRILKSCNPSLVVLLEHLPRLLPRPYSIASFNPENPNNFKIIFSVEHEGANIKGLTTRMLVEKIEKRSSWKPTVNFYFRQPTSFQYTIEDLAKNVIMIGPGTGVAPFLGFLQFRQQFLKETGAASQETGEAWLFTGCRYEKKNNLFDKQIRTYLDSGVLNTHSAAFSRDPGSQFKYVQDAIVGHKEKFIKLLVSEQTKLYVCGEGKHMLPGIEATIIKCLESVNNHSSDEAATAMVVAMKKEGRYIEDVWF